MPTPHPSKYWAALLSAKGAAGSIASISRSLASARVDLNPHQVDAALFALRSPLSKGVILADEVGLGKTIEACIVIAQRWAERRRRILLILPATLRKQVLEYVRFTQRTPITRQEKLAAQKALKSLQEARNRKRKELFEAQDAVEAKRDTLIENLELQSQQTHDIHPLFELQWIMGDKA